MIYDVTVPIQDKMVVWPGDPDVRVDTVLDVNQGDAATVRQLRLGSHTGTHVDAFCHFKSQGKSLDEMDLAVYLGPCRLIEISPARAVIEPADLLPYGLENPTAWPDTVRRLLLKTRNSTEFWGDKPFNTEFVYLSPEAAAYLLSCHIKLVAIDYLSVEGYHVEAAPTHHQLMDAGVYIVEGLYLKDVSPGNYELLCLPLKIHQGDGAPARVVLRELSQPSMGSGK